MSRDSVPVPRFRDQLAEAAAALVAHHVSPAIGWWRAADAQGETFDRALLADRYKRAAEAVLELACAEVAARVQAAANQRAVEELRAMAAELSDSDQYVEIALGGAAYVQTWLSDRAAALDAEAGR